MGAGVRAFTVDRFLELTRRDDDLSRRLRRIVVGFSQWSLRPGALHRLLLAERNLRRQLVDELARSLYWQPLFAAQCARIAGPFRMEICPDSKLPVVVNCRVELGRGVRLSARTTFSGARNAPKTPRITIGDGTYVGHRVVLRAGLGIHVGARCYVASNAILGSDPGHPLDPVERRSGAAPAESLGTLVIGDDVWIADGAAIVAGVRIGDGAVVAARSVVTKDVPPRALVAGTPARVIRIIGEGGLSAAG